MMEEFEKWEEEICCKSLPEICGDIAACKDCHRLHKEGWKAALEVVAGKLSDIEEHKDLIEFIEKELGTVIFKPYGRNEYAII